MFDKRCDIAGRTSFHFIFVDYAFASSWATMLMTVHKSVGNDMHLAHIEPVIRLNAWLQLAHPNRQWYNECIIQP